MMFCPKCGAIVVPKKTKTTGKMRLSCASCSYSTNKKEKIVLKETVTQSKKDDIEVISKRIETLPKVQETCPKCQHREAFYWLVQTRAGDEAETRFFKCVKCTHTWRASK